MIINCSDLSHQKVKSHFKHFCQHKNQYKVYNLKKEHTFAIIYNTWLCSSINVWKLLTVAALASCGFSGFFFGAESWLPGFPYIDKRETICFILQNLDFSFFSGTSFPCKIKSGYRYYMMYILLSKCALTIILTKMFSSSSLIFSWFCRIFLKFCFS